MPVHPTQLYEALALAVIATLLFRWRAAGVRDTQVLGRYLVLAGAVRFGIEFIRVNERLVGPLTLAHMIALGLVLAGVLALKSRLHQFATSWLSETELHDGLLLAALALVLLPLLPTEPIAWLGHLSPRRVLMLVLVILLMQAASHLGQRLLGQRAGVPVAGLLGGFVSSTATISALGSQVRSGEMPLRLAWCGGVLSTAATWLQAWLIGGVLAPSHVSEMMTLALVGAAMPCVIGLALWRRQAVGEPAAAALVNGSMLRIKEAVQVSGLLLGGLMAWSGWLWTRLKLDERDPMLGVPVGLDYLALVIAGVLIVLFCIEHLIALWRGASVQGAGV